jgi:hypothetical protein
MMAGQSGGLAMVIERTNNNSFGNTLEMEVYTYIYIMDVRGQP